MLLLLPVLLVVVVVVVVVVLLLVRVFLLLHDSCGSCFSTWLNNLFHVIKKFTRRFFSLM